MDILDRRHFAMRTQLESLYTCDLKHSSTKKILQIGAGNGLWCMVILYNLDVLLTKAINKGNGQDFPQSSSNRSRAVSG